MCCYPEEKKLPRQTLKKDPQRTRNLGVLVPNGHSIMAHSAKKADCIAW